METAIKVEGLGKRYRIGAQQRAYRTLREKLNETAMAPFRAMKSLTNGNGNGNGNGHAKAETFWALKEISFEVRPGEVVGVIGRNGAGKSTLLKILSRITEPTEGYADITGRIASLLEVGTGFHPELSGRENIFLNGSILGMKRVEIRRKFDEMVAFAEIEKFIDTPVKHYSSGMYVRLAFAVAAHLDPEILLVDEVLAVGDAAFQKKCLGKMGDVAREGRTVLFVSHNMSAISSLCKRALLIRSGRLSEDGLAGDVASIYQSEAMGLESNEVSLVDMHHKGSGKAQFTAIDIRATSETDQQGGVFVSGSDLVIETTVKCLSSIVDSNVAVIIYDSNGYRLIDVNTALDGKFLSMQPGDEVTVRFLLNDVLLKPGTYYVGLWIGRGGVEEIDAVDFARTFTVIPDLESTRHTETFPGAYLCKFSSVVEHFGVR
jgi:lipopolysaccharide transport system ATP-binding protein